VFWPILAAQQSAAPDSRWAECRQISLAFDSFQKTPVFGALVMADYTIPYRTARSCLGSSSNTGDLVKSGTTGQSAERKVLIVEDNVLNMKLFNDLLEAHGYATIQIMNGREALGAARQHRPDLILMDIQLPEVSGIEITKSLKKDKELRDIPVIAVTAFAIGDIAAPIACALAAVSEQPAYFVLYAPFKIPVALIWPLTDCSKRCPMQCLYDIADNKCSQQTTFKRFESDADHISCKLVEIVNQHQHDPHSAQTWHDIADAIERLYLKP
jgi:two-component system, cell cycle response regulator DivK